MVQVCLQLHSLGLHQVCPSITLLTKGYISRSVAGSYDNEAIAIFLLMFTFFLWIRALKTGSAFWGALTALFYFYMVAAWGNLSLSVRIDVRWIRIYYEYAAFTCVRSHSYGSLFFPSLCCIFNLLCLRNTRLNANPFRRFHAGPHIRAYGRTRLSAPFLHLTAGIFGLIQLIAFTQLIRSLVPSKQFEFLLRVFIVAVFVLSFAALVVLTLTGTIAPWTGRFYSLWDTGYAKIHIPIIASVSEHQPTPWPSYFYDLSWLIWLFPGGVYLSFRRLGDEHVFVIIYAVMVLPLLSFAEG